MHLQYFYFLLFLYFFHQPILATNQSGQFILEKIDKFHGDIKKKFKGFYSHFDEKIDKEMAEQLGNSMLKREFPSEIKNAKDDVEKYLRGEKTLQMILNEMNRLKLEDGNLDELKGLQKQLNEKRQQKSTLKKITSNLFGSTEKQLKLVKFLIETHELVNKFVDEMVVILRIHWFKVFLKKLDHHINEQNGQLEMQYNNFVQKYSATYLPKIENVIGEEKGKLRKIYKNNVPSSDIMEEDLKKLKEAIFIKDPLLEKVTLNMEHSTPDYVKILYENLNEAVDRLPNQIDLLLENDEKEEFAKLHALESLNVACNKLLDRIKLFFEQIIENNPLLNNGDLPAQHLADIHWYTKFIAKELAKMNESTQVQIQIHIPNMAEAMEMEELPNELELKNGEMMDLKKKAILIAQNMFFLTAQFYKEYKFTYGANQVLKSRREELYKMIANDMTPTNIGQFFYQKYKEILKEYNSGTETEMLTKSGHYNVESVNFEKFGR